MFTVNFLMVTLQIMFLFYNYVNEYFNTMLF